MRNKKGIVIGGIGLLLIGFIAGNMTSSDSEEGTVSGSESQAKVKYWVAPMDPNYKRDKPGKSPMGMDLVPVYEDSELTDDSVVKISPQVVNNLGVKTTKVEKATVSKIIDTVGYAVVDENNIEHVTTYVDGWIKNLVVKTTGEKVKEGQLLFELYSPTLVQAQEEYILALNSNNTQLIEAGKKKLINLGVSKEQIESISRTKSVNNDIKIYAAQQGIISNLSVREGMFIKPDTQIMTIEDLSRIWVISEVFEKNSNLVKVGQTAVAVFPYMPGKEWIGAVDYVYPSLDKATHTLRVRVTFPNIDTLIKPNMYANVHIHANPLKDVLTIPSSALIRTGDGDRVILSLGDGRYRPQPVKVGQQSNGQHVVLSGLELGDAVVTSAQFLIDSESSLKASFSRMESKSIDDKNDTEFKEYMAMASVTQVNQEKHSILLDHQPIPEIKMPAMKMEIKVDKNVDLSHLSEGDNIHFIFIMKDDEMLITQIHVR